MILFFLTSFLGQIIAAPRAVPRAELVKRLAYYLSIAKLEAKFHGVKHLKSMGLNLESDGELTVVRPNRVVWKVTKPSALSVTLEGAKMEIKGADGKTETYTADGQARESMQALVAWLKLDPDELLAQYRIFDLGGETYRFEPLSDTGAPVTAMQMRLKPGSYLERLEITEKSGDTLEIRFEKPRIERRNEKH